MILFTVTALCVLHWCATVERFFLYRTGTNKVVFVVVVVCGRVTSATGARSKGTRGNENEKERKVE